MTEDGLPDFFGKVVFVQPPTEGHYWALVEARFERQGGSWMLVGKPIRYEDKPHWSDNATIGFRWKYVAYYAVFESIEEFEASWQKAAAAVEAPKVPRRDWLGRRRDA